MFAHTLLQLWRECIWGSLQSRDYHCLMRSPLLDEVIFPSHTGGSPPPCYAPSTTDHCETSTVLCKTQLAFSFLTRFLFTSSSLPGHKDSNMAYSSLIFGICKNKVNGLRRKRNGFLSRTPYLLHLDGEI